VVGEACWVAGTTDAGPDGRSLHPGDPTAQARAIFKIIAAALAEAGFGLRDVVRTRMYVTEPAHVAEVGAVHGEVFADIRPAATAIVVAALIDPSLLVEIEVDAVRGAWSARPSSGEGCDERGDDGPDEQSRRAATSTTQAPTASHSMPTWKLGLRSASMATMTFTAASVARMAGPTRRRYSDPRGAVASLGRAATRGTGRSRRP
jgi:enamine deaminase RidA (YjgF/YER057c/UK114 family)